MNHPWYIRVWNEGNSFDFWHIQHFIAGMVLADLVLLSGMNYILGLVISFVLIVGWEFMEISLGIKETFFNMSFDIIFSIIAFFTVVELHNTYLTKQVFLNQFYFSIFFYIIFAVWGFCAYRIRTRTHKEERVGKKILKVVKKSH